jgi:hypothetical protein
MTDRQPNQQILHITPREKGVTLVEKVTTTNFLAAVKKWGAVANHLIVSEELLDSEKPEGESGTMMGIWVANECINWSLFRATGNYCDVNTSTVGSFFQFNSYPGQGTLREK